MRGGFFSNTRGIWLVGFSDGVLLASFSKLLSRGTRNWSCIDKLEQLANSPEENSFGKSVLEYDAKRLLLGFCQTGNGRCSRRCLQQPPSSGNPNAQPYQTPSPLSTSPIQKLPPPTPLPDLAPSHLPK